MVRKTIVLHSFLSSKLFFFFHRSLLTLSFQFHFFFVRLWIPSSIPPQSPLPLLPIAYRTREWKALISKTLCLSSMFVWWREGGREKEERKKEKPLKITYDIVVNGQMFVNAGLVIEFILHRRWNIFILRFSHDEYFFHIIFYLSYNEYTSLVVNVRKLVSLSVL